MIKMIMMMMFKMVVFKMKMVMFKMMTKMKNLQVHSAEFQ